MEGQIRLFVLKKDSKDASSVFRLKKGWKVCFTCDPVLQTENVRLFWNYSTDSTQSSSEQYSELEWQKNDQISEGYDVITSPVDITTAGAFQYYFTIDGSLFRDSCNGYGYFIVDPMFTVGKDNKPLSLDAIQLQTVLPKLLGTFSAWKDRLRVSHKSGYNMIHFTPLQKLNNESNSSYSISDQLTLNPLFSSEGTACTLAHIASLVEYMRDEWEVLSVTDMVYNHTANDSAWLYHHPESSYNLLNSPHLKPAYLLDRLIYYTSVCVASNKLVSKGIPAKLTSHDHIEALREYLKQEMSGLRIHEYYALDTHRIVQQFNVSLKEVISGLRNAPGTLLPQMKKISHNDCHIKQDSKYRRCENSIDVRAFLSHYTEQIIQMVTTSSDEISLISDITSDFEKRISELNAQKLDEVQGHLDAALQNVIQGVSYRFLAEHGPKLGEVTDSKPLVDFYFINKKVGYTPLNLEDDMKSTESDDSCKYIMAHNGWVFGDDPMKNFAEAGSHVYMRRELVVWGDSVKLRYGKEAADSPYLWQRMEEYTKQTVEIFHGIRLDNCHSTPLHVAEHMMRYARRINADLYVMAELFTSHENLDNVFVNRLGLNSLIREGLSAWDAHEQGRLVHRYGGVPVGSFSQPNVQLLKPCVAHALFMDATHDNESITEKRTVEDSLSLSAYVSMSCCASGSNRGYDELVPHHISVADEERLYRSWSDSKLSPDTCNSQTGIIVAKRVLNNLHQYMGHLGYEQVYVHDLSNDVVSITRHNPHTHESVICVVRSAFTNSGEDNPHCDHLTFEGGIDEVILHGYITQTSDEKFRRDDHYLNGLTSHTTVIQSYVSIDSIPGIRWGQSSSTTQTISLHHFPPGSVIIISVLPNKDLVTAQEGILKTVSEIQEYVSKGKQAVTQQTQGIHDMMRKLTLVDLNAVMYHCEAEEKSINGYGSYNVPNYGSLVYTGLQGISSPMSRIRSINDLGHPLCQNLREGDWLIGYITSRLSQYKALKQLTAYIKELMRKVKILPRYLIPCYFDVALAALSMLINQTVWNMMGRFMSEGSPFIRQLALCSQQFCGVVESAKLSRLSPSLLPKYKNKITGETQIMSISAGLPHFSEGIMRIWGRDTFIALRGLLLVTDRFKEAKAIILSFGGTVRHGLIPNLHGEGIHARYNCRDASWWWLQAIQDYCKMAPSGESILAEPVLGLYPTDDSQAYESGEITTTLMEVIQEVLQRHADGISFRERNAGPAIDEHMSDEGFNVQAGIDWSTGFVYGGNEYNCGTWMDKMGSSDKAGNKGKPATARNGSAVELVGLSASTALWLSDLYNKGMYPYAGVSAKRPSWSAKQELTYTVWYNLIKRNFEKHFWVDGTYTSMERDPRPDLINKRNIYKDSVGSTASWTDYQLRPNFPIALVVAPDLFSTENAVAALEMAGKHLVGQLGMKTLDSSDWNYNGDYINSDDSDNYNTARGFNYHNGPEWLWPLGYYLRAKLIVARRLEKDKPSITQKTIRSIENKLTSHHLTILQSDWRSLPELTNSGGKPCDDSCPAQAWSVSCLMDVLYDISLLRGDNSKI